jgi:hypothetical protein
MPRLDRKIYNDGSTKIGSNKQRIRIQQNAFRPFKLLQKTFLKAGLLRSPAWWLTHRRGLLKGRPKVGEDPQEMRAIPKSLVKGTLPERIVYKTLLEFHFVPDIDFDFQSSQEGGRLEIGGLVADFLFRYLMLVIQVQGPTHQELNRIRKDQEQTSILAEMGYQVVEISQELILNQNAYEDYMRSLFNLGRNLSNIDGPHSTADGSTIGDWNFSTLQSRVNVLEASLIGFHNKKDALTLEADSWWSKHQ